MTTILSHSADKTGLKLWEEFVGTKKADKERKQATDLGSLMHEHLECYAQNIPRPRGNNMIRQMAERMADRLIERELGHVSEVWGMEEALYFPGLYAGTADLIGLYKGQPAIMDYKTAKKMRNKSMIQDYFDQMAAYGFAHNEKYGTDIQIGVVFMVSRDLNHKAFIIEKDDFKNHEVSFMSKVEKYYNDYPTHLN